MGLIQPSDGVNTFLCICINVPKLKHLFHEQQFAFCCRLTTLLSHHGIARGQCQQWTVGLVVSSGTSSNFGPFAGNCVCGLSALLSVLVPVSAVGLVQLLSLLLPSNHVDMSTCAADHPVGIFHLAPFSAPFDAYLMFMSMLCIYLCMRLFMFYCFPVFGICKTKFAILRRYKSVFELRCLFSSPKVFQHFFRDTLAGFVYAQWHPARLGWVVK